MPIVCFPLRSLARGQIQATQAQKPKESGCPTRTSGKKRQKESRRSVEEKRSEEKSIKRMLKRGTDKGEAGKQKRKRTRIQQIGLILGQMLHISSVTRDQGRHVSSQIAPQTHWQELSAETGERLFLALSHARVNHKQLQTGAAIKRPGWCGAKVCGRAVSGRHSVTQTKPSKIF